MTPARRPTAPTPSKVKFLANMSHELRTPLNAVIGFSDMLMNEERMRLDGPRRQEYAKLINDSGTPPALGGQRHPRHVEDGDRRFRNFAGAVRAGPGDRQLLRYPGAQGARVRASTSSTRLAANLPDIVADKRAFKQILLNLISNAVKFTDRGGRVVVSRHDRDGRYRRGGRGHRRRHQRGRSRRVGRPFFQARGAYDRRHDGTGLGLSIVQGLVALHGGEVNIQSRLGEGTRVRVRLPVDCEAARSGSAAFERVASVVRAGGRGG